MTDQQTPPDWVLIEAAKRCFREGEDIVSLQDRYDYLYEYRALCDMIQKHEQPPVDRKLLCAREADRLYLAGTLNEVEDVAIRAIELWESGLGNERS
jgi:hypothetical protein